MRSNGRPKAAYVQGDPRERHGTVKVESVVECAETVAVGEVEADAKHLWRAQGLVSLM